MSKAIQTQRFLSHGTWSAAVTVLAVLAMAPTSFAAGERQIVGAGSSFAAPAIEAWSTEFSQDHPIDVLYRSVGSGEGLQRLAGRSVDFAVTDLPMTQADLIQEDFVQYPLVAGAIVPVANLPGIGPEGLHLSGSILADIFLGKIAWWNAPELAALNPELKLPNIPIKVVHRADSSGSTFVFTYYLSKVSPEWNRQLGIGSRLSWPVGTAVRGNEGVAQEVKDTVGSIGYVEYAYVLKFGLTPTGLSNRAGRFVSPSAQGVLAALAATKFSRPSYYEVAVDQDGEDSWPIVGISYVLLSRSPADVEAARKSLQFFDWVYRRGYQSAQKSHYVLIGDERLIRRIESSWKEIKDQSGRSIRTDR